MARIKNRRQTSGGTEIEKGIIFSIMWPPTLALMATLTVAAAFCKRLNDEAVSANAELPSLVPLFWTMAAFVIAALLFLVYSARKLSSRVGGPMLRTKSHLLTILSGESIDGPLTLRKGDFLADIVGEINQLAVRFMRQAAVDTEARTHDCRVVSEDCAELHHARMRSDSTFAP